MRISNKLLLLGFVLSSACDSAPLGSDPGDVVDAGVDAESSAVDAESTSVDAESTDVDADDAGFAPCECFEGSGDYCEAEVARRALESGCAALDASVEGSRVLACQDATWTVSSECATGCDSGEEITTASCALPICDCFVRVAWCGAGVGRHGLELDPPCRVPLAEEHDQDILGCDGDRWVVQQACEEGCYEATTGTPDACIETRSPTNPGWDPCPHRERLAYGVHPEASDRLRCSGVEASRITQTIGSAAASAGYHASDGTAEGQPYTAAIDLRARDLSEAQIRALLERLGRNGFAAWYRKPGSDGWPSGEAPHIHAVFAGVVMKSQLRGQVRDFLIGRNGLTSHSTYTFYRTPAAVLDIVRLAYSRHYTPP